MSTERPPEVLFVCVHNAGRSQMAAGLLKLRAGNKVSVRSAGSEPADSLNPAVIEAMAELGIDLTGESPKLRTWHLCNEIPDSIRVILNVVPSSPAFR